MALAAEKGEEEAESAPGKKQRRGIVSRLWRGLLGARSEDYEKRLQYLSKEEASVRARMKRRTQSSRRMVRNIIVLSVLLEVGAVVYVIMAARSLELNWRMRAIRVLPMIILPGLSSAIYSTLASLRRMRKYLKLFNSCNLAAVYIVIILALILLLAIAFIF